MKAIVLTYDRNRTITDHMILKYDEIWPDHPFRFRIPYQDLIGQDDDLHEFVKTPKDIKNTILTLLQDLDDKEWIYWCIDDKYPEQLNIEKIKNVYNGLNNQPLGSADAVLFCLKKDFLLHRVHKKQFISDPKGNFYYKRKSYANFWIHQFARVQVIRKAFERFPDDIPNAKFMDTVIKNLQVPFDQNLYCTSESLAFFGESSSAGALTANCFESMKKRNLKIPPLQINNHQYYFIGTPLSNKIFFPYFKQKIRLFLRRFKK